MADLNKINMLKPFARFCATIGNLPSSYMLSMTYEEQVLWLCDYIEKTIIPALNNDSEAIIELQNYLKNLDLTEEVSQKLDEMALDGTLDQIINQEIFSGLNTDIQANTNAIAELQRHKYLLIGDSYLQGWTPDGTFTSWGEYFETKTGYDCDIAAYGGACFSNYSNSFYALIDNVQATDYTDVIIMGGYNDLNGSFTNIVNGIADCVDLCRTKFPNLKEVYIGMIGNSTDYEKTNPLVSVLRAYIHGTKENNAKYLNGVEFSLCQESYFSTDGIHPIANGQYSIAINLINAINTGYANQMLSYESITIDFDSDYSGTFANCGGYLNNNTLDIECQGRNTITCNNVELTCNCSNFLKLGTINTDLMIKGNYSNLIINVPAIIKNDGDYFDVNAIIKIYNKEIYFGCFKINADNSNYETFTKIEQIQLAPFHASFVSNTI